MDERLPDKTTRVEVLGDTTIAYGFGNGAFDNLDDASPWPLPRCVEEVETGRRALNLGTMHVLGQSRRDWLGTDGGLTHLEPDAYVAVLKTFLVARRG